MPAKVTLTTTEGAPEHLGREHTFEERTSCIVGRDEECEPQVPNDEAHKTISRHHCLLDINPPDITVRDFGSLNGTQVNGEKIGQRDAGMSPEEGASLEFPEYDLKDGDLLKMSTTVFRVGIYVPAVCNECSNEIPETEREQAKLGPDSYLCRACKRKAEQAKRRLAVKPKPKVCEKCGKDVTKEVGFRQGKFVCKECRTVPLEILKLLLANANRGNKGLQSIRGFTIIRLLGKGGMGAVYLAKKEKSSEEVALKVMLPQVGLTRGAEESFLREVENTKALKHPNVVEYRDSGCSDGTFWMTLEFCDAGDVAHLAANSGGKISLEAALEIIFPALDGLEYAHTAIVPKVKLKDGTYGKGTGLVHRDLKPGNIFLSNVGGTRVAKIADFGLAKAFDLAGLSGNTRTGSRAGTPVFMPRQQVINFKYAKPGVDVWAMAASLYNMLTGRLPREIPRGQEPMKYILENSPIPIQQRDRNVPARLAQVIDTALNDSPTTLHFQSAKSFRRALEEAL